MKSDDRARTNASNYESQIVLCDGDARRCEDERLDEVFGKERGVVWRWKSRRTTGIGTIFLTESCESLEAHTEQSYALWGTERVDIWEACRELALVHPSSWT